MLEKALALDPKSSIANSVYANLLYEAHRDDEGPLLRETMRAESGLSQSAVGRALKDLERCYIRITCLDANRRFSGYRYWLSNQHGSVSTD